MPIVKFQGQTINCEPFANLRKVLLDRKLDLYNGNLKYINCRGIGSCGTCAVEIIGISKLLNTMAFGDKE